MKPIVRRIGYVVAALVLVLITAAAAVYVASENKIASGITVPLAPITLPTDSASLARGRHLTGAIMKCMDCHGDDLGGFTIVENGAMGRWTGPNLTGGGLGANRTDAEIARAVRHGVDPKGRKLLLMPSKEYSYVSDSDLAAVVAHIRSLPSVDRTPGRISYGPVLRGLIAFGIAPMFEADLIDHARRPQPTPPEGPTAVYGAYISRIGGCQGCHGETLSGGTIPGGDPAWLPPSNLTPTGIGHYTEADFFTLLREGKRPGGAMVTADMPVKWTKEMTDDEIRAVWAFLRTVPPKEFGNR